jgi:hypothetical protein
LVPFGSGFEAVGLAARIERRDAEIHRVYRFYPSACAFLKTDAVVDELLRLSHSGAACILAGNYRASPSRCEAL